MTNTEFLEHNTELFLEALEKTWEEFSNGDKGLQSSRSGDLVT
jgi:hypothetical protein